MLEITLMKSYQLSKHELNEDKNYYAQVDWGKAH